MTAATQVHLATAADLLRLPGDVRAEIIDGEIVEKAGSLPEHGIA
ncbi:MAG: Uma2 family endonuclease [Polyangiaceae bacterium]|nr:Uma2 family endonuclease [Polyangiaceae bacterium]